MTDFESLYRDHAGDVQRFALYLSGDREHAADLVSETFIRVWAARERVDLTTVKSYLFAITRNLFLRGRERGRREAPLEDASELPTADAGPRVDASRELEQVLLDLQSLPEADRAALLLRAEAELPYEEIASVLGLSVSAAKVKVHRARIKLIALRERRGAKEGT